MNEDYLLGVHNQELHRLERQHRAWQPETIQLIEDANLRSCKSILDIGSGPGFTSLELAKQCPQSKIIALDKADLYQDYLNQLIKAQSITQIEPLHADLLEMDGQNNKYEGAFCRWLLAFLISDLTSVLSSIYDQLKPGGVFAAMEYLSLDTFTCSPPSKHFDAYRQAWTDFYLNNGGDANIGTYLPQSLKSAGFEIESIKSVGGHAPVGHRYYNWWKDAYDNFGPVFVEQGLMTAADFDGLAQYWKEQEKNPEAFVYSCIIQQVVARK